MNNQHAIDAAATLAKITELCVNNKPVPTGLIMAYGEQCFQAGMIEAASGQPRLQKPVYTNVFIQH